MGLASSKRLASTPVTRAFCGAGAACAAFGLAPPLAHAQIEGLRSGNAPIAECDAGNECFTLLGVTLEGAQAIPARELAQHYEPYLAHAVSARDLAMIADAITAHYRSRGYFLSRAIVPPQDAASGLARIVVLEGRISEVVIEGPGARQAAPHLRGLDHQPIANLTDLDCRLALASDTPGLTLRSRIEPTIDDPTRHRLVVVTEFATIQANLDVDTRGPRDWGPVQAYGRVVGNSLLRTGDQLSLSVFAAPADPSALTYAEIGYAMIYANGARLGASISGSRSNHGHDMASPEVGGDSESVSVRYDHPLLRRRWSGVWLTSEVDASRVRSDWLGGGGHTDQLRVARVGLRGFLDDRGRATTSFVARASFGLDLAGASPMSPTNRSRPDADAIFSSYRLHAAHYRDLGRYFGVYATIDAQWSDEPLLFSEEFTLGGAPYGRAYGAGEVSGDRGVAGAVELRAGADPGVDPISFVQGYLFADAGEVWNFDGNADQLASVGAGVRLTFDERLTAGFEIARPLEGVPIGESDRDWRHFLSLSAAY